MILFTILLVVWTVASVVHFLTKIGHKNDTQSRYAVIRILEWVLWIPVIIITCLIGFFDRNKR